MAGTGDQLAGGLLPFALRAVREGQSGNQFVLALRESGAGIRRQTALRLYGQAKALAAEYGAEPGRPLSAVPTFAEARQWPTRASAGVLQTVQLVYRERVTQRLVTRYFNVKTPEGVTRGEAIRRAIDANTSNAERYQQDLLGAVHTGTAVLVATEAA